MAVDRMKQRVKTARRRSAASTRWLERQLNDPYVHKARAEGYRSRAAYKLIELDERFGFLKGVRNVVDLGAAPGGWCQVVVNKHPKAQIVAIDLLDMDELPNTTILKMDFLSDEAPQALIDALGAKADIVLRSEDRRVGKGCGSTCRYRWSLYH